MFRKHLMKKAKRKYTQENIRNVLREAFASGAACAASKIYDTLKMADSSMFIEFTPDRSRAYSAQTPQVFKSDIYRACAYSAKKDGFIATDDCMLAEHYGFKVKLVDCGRENIKITTPVDLYIAEAILRYRRDTVYKNEEPSALPEESTSKKSPKEDA